MTSRRESGRGFGGELEELGEAPFDRGLLLLAEMSSEGSLMTGEYTRRCVGAARQFSDFVVGFIAQRCLNEAAGDRFITMTPGVSLPPANGATRDHGDGLGQQYNTPKSVILEKGIDVIIVGRGILKADSPKEEAERYRRAGWDAYEQRIASKK
jgi:uridine monophosphate synthetase